MFGKIKYSLMGSLVLVLLACQPNEKEDLVVEESLVVMPQALPYFNTPDFDPVWDSEEGQPHQVTDFSFVNQNGEMINLATFDNKIYLTNFFFTACGSICPKMNRNMETVQSAFKEEDAIMFLSHTVTPDRDSVERLKEYTANFNVMNDKWHFVTGDKTEIYSMARQVYFAEEEPGFNKDSTEFLHTEHFILIDQNKRIRGVYNGTIQLEMDRIIEDIELLLTEG